MTVMTPGYILEISDASLAVNGHPMPLQGSVRLTLDAVLEQLSALSQQGASKGGLGIVIKDSRPDGLGQVSKTIAPGESVSVASFTTTTEPKPAATAAAPGPTPTPAPEAAEVAAATSSPALAADVALEGRSAPQEAANGRRQGRRSTAVQEALTRESGAPATTPGNGDPEHPATNNSQGVSSLSAAADEIDYDSIFTAEEPIVDEGIRTPIGQGLTARQRTEGFSLKSNARIKVEQREARKRKIIVGTVAMVILAAAARLVLALLAGAGGEYAGICVDARTLQRVSNVSCTDNSNPFAQLVYFSQGQTVPAVGGKAPGGSVTEPQDAATINTDVAEGREGIVESGGQVK